MPHVVFLGTSKSGLGHLRRICNIAQRLVDVRPDLRLTLLTNGQPDGLPDADMQMFNTILLAERADMAGALAGLKCDLAVMDTLKLPGLAAYRGPAVLILRETPEQGIAAFGRDGGAPWECVLLPNPQNHWCPALPPGFTRQTQAVGWITRKSGPRAAHQASAGIVLATGGGGTAETRAELYPLLSTIIGQARMRCQRPFRLRQALGPRSGGAALLEADETFDPGGDLDQVFRAADLVISTAGYNSVLELAGTDTPTLLVGIPRSLDDQFARVCAWGPKLGHGLDPEAPEVAADWLAAEIARPRRRPLVDLGHDGAEVAAQALADLL